MASLITELDHIDQDTRIRYYNTGLEKNPKFEHGEWVMSNKGVLGILTKYHVLNKENPFPEDTINVIAFYPDKVIACQWKASNVKRFSGIVTITQY
jgi:hypothetical protein